MITKRDKRLPKHFSVKSRETQTGAKLKRQKTDMEKAKAIMKLQDDIKKIQNSILANGCYGDMEKERQLMKAQTKGELTSDENKVIEKAWKIRKQTTKKLIKLLEAILDEKDTNES